MIWELLLNVKNLWIFRIGEVSGNIRLNSHKEDVIVRCRSVYFDMNNPVSCVCVVVRLYKCVYECLFVMLCVSAVGNSCLFSTYLTISFIQQFWRLNTRSRFIPIVCFLCDERFVWASIARLCEKRDCISFTFVGVLYLDRLCPICLITFSFFSGSHCRVFSKNRR